MAETDDVRPLTPGGGSYTGAHGHMPDSWLYAKGDSAVRIVRTGTRVFEVLGPGEYREHHAFENDSQLAAFLQRTQEQLTSVGYEPHGYDAERRTSHQPHPKGDRRRPS